jgi:aspartate dehydrogenase
MNICIIGCGAIGSVLARATTGLEGVQRICLFDQFPEQSERLHAEIPDSMVVRDIKEIPDDVELVIEAASQNAVRNFGKEVLERGFNLMVMSVGALIDEKFYDELRKTAGENGVRIYIPSGAIGGLDVINSAAVGGIHELSLKTSKPPKGLTNISFITAVGIDVEKIERPTVVFDGSVVEAIQKFPLNINVASILALAGPGREHTRVRIIVDPDIERNIHEISMRGEFGEMKCTIQNKPHPDNPKTSYLAALSAIATVKKIVGVVSIGT